MEGRLIWVGLPFVLFLMSNYKKCTVFDIRRIMYANVSGHKNSIMYKNSFRSLVKDNANNEFIGLGNPASNILIVGKEAATDTESTQPIEVQNTISYKQNCQNWRKNIASQTLQENIPNWNFNDKLEKEEVHNNPLYAFKGSIKKHTSSTWRNYQKLHDIIFKNELISDNLAALTFQKDFFITEMSDFPSLKTKDAQKGKLSKKA